MKYETQLKLTKSLKVYTSWHTFFKVANWVSVKKVEIIILEINNVDFLSEFFGRFQNLPKNRKGVSST